MRPNQINNEQILDIFEEWYIEYLKKLNYSDSDVDFSEKVRKFNNFYWEYLNNYPYRPILSTEDFIRSKTSMCFENIFNSSKEEKPVFIIEQLLNHCFTQEEIKPKKVWTFKLDKYWPHIITGLGFLLSFAAFVLSALHCSPCL